MNSQQAAKQQGFTLIEVMIAMAIFALLSLLAYQILSASLKNSEMAQEHTARLTEIQTAFSLLERDLTQILPRQTDEEEAFLSASETSLSFTTISSDSASAPLSASDLTRATWTFTDHTLTRSAQALPSPPLTDLSPLIPFTLLTGVKSLHWRFYSSDWTNSWSKPDTFPKVIELVVTLEDMGEIRRLFLLPQTIEETKAESVDNPSEQTGSEAAAPIPLNGESAINE
ncbi:type II secretion system minor pseudopilin GspJ [Rahnella aquatilis]|uniref:Type II secretion system protein J n=1 Tax=Rahnella aquatilis (strain ATCC 33071 / DSM 4594 / JCM 1683 / NBRC 105701 / NCIMB 13365 / CIP 78.65) TaxID=745277 RepID=H2IR95_RAHAC|nr:type II secretion system minor pseudopilin GspJ [Rahnella aquatilis]AEX50295.1 general secretion pathway protein J [Rahnella aquatilis CIP 78.65 = ATCC 33071]KFD01261.1 general secretion pathway protein J [Rahnella aquatilis CIP 78.65 = ATCC 33071]